MLMATKTTTYQDIFHERQFSLTTLNPATAFVSKLLIFAAGRKSRRSNEKEMRKMRDRGQELGTSHEAPQRRVQVQRLPRRVSQ